MDLKHANRMVGIGEVLMKRYLGNQHSPGLVKEIPRGEGGAVVVE